MAGLDPAIYGFLAGRKDVDARHKAGHDDDGAKPPPAGRTFAKLLNHLPVQRQIEVFARDVE